MPLRPERRKAVLIGLDAAHAGVLGPLHHGGPLPGHRPAAASRGERRRVQRAATGDGSELEHHRHGGVCRLRHDLFDEELF